MSKQIANHLGQGRNLYLFRGDQERITQMFTRERELNKLFRNAEKHLWAEYQKAKAYITEAK